jgi:F-box/leucine-rich repeat protein 2/20
MSLSKCSGVSDIELSFSMSNLKNLQKLDITCCRDVTNVSVGAITSSCIFCLYLLK